MIPFVNIPPLQIGPLSLHAFGLAVAVAVLVGIALAKRRAVRWGLDASVAERLVSWTLVGGLLGAHWLAVLLYFPRQIIDDPLVLLRFWDHLSSFGGMIGGLVALALVIRFGGLGLSGRDGVRYLNVIAFVFPVSLAIGRAGCSVVHDHPGVLTTFPLAVSLESQAAQGYAASTFPPAALANAGERLASVGFHDLGLYELLFLVVFLIPIFALLDRRYGATVPYEVAFVLLYMPVRFGLDFLRIADVQYAGLTPAQWLALGALAATPIYLRYRRQREAADSLVSERSP